MSLNSDFDFSRFFFFFSYFFFFFAVHIFATHYIVAHSLLRSSPSLLSLPFVVFVLFSASLFNFHSAVYFYFIFFFAIFSFVDTKRSQQKNREPRKEVFCSFENVVLVLDFFANSCWRMWGFLYFFFFRLPFVLRLCSHRRVHELQTGDFEFFFAFSFALVSYFFFQFVFFFFFDVIFFLKFFVAKWSSACLCVEAFSLVLSSSSYFLMCCLRTWLHSCDTTQWRNQLDKKERNSFYSKANRFANGHKIVFTVKDNKMNFIFVSLFFLCLQQ